jgi:hypothetical protein
MFLLEKQKESEPSKDVFGDTDTGRLLRKDFGCGY